MKAARRPIVGADKVSRFLLGIAEDAMKLDLRFALVNGELGFLAYDGDALRSVLLLEVEDGRIANVYVVANPEKLAHIGN